MIENASVRHIHTYISYFSQWAAHFVYESQFLYISSVHAFDIHLHSVYVYIRTLSGALRICSVYSHASQNSAKLTACAAMHMGHTLRITLSPMCRRYADVAAALLWEKAESVYAYSIYVCEPVCMYVHNAVHCVYGILMEGVCMYVCMCVCICVCMYDHMVWKAL